MSPLYILVLLSFTFLYRELDLILVKKGELLLSFGFDLVWCCKVCLVGLGALQRVGSPIFKKAFAHSALLVASRARRLWLYYNEGEWN